MKSFNELWGTIISDYRKQNKYGYFSYIRDDGYITVSSIQKWTNTNISEAEAKALEYATEKIVDFGCGNAKHLLYLNQAGKKNLVGIDCCPQVFNDSMYREIPHQCCKMEDVVDRIEEIDTSLIMGNAICELGSIQNITIFLKKLKSKLTQNGVVIISIKDLTLTTEKAHLDYQENNLRNGKYIGETHIRLKYNDELSEYADICYLSFDTLNEIMTSTEYSLKNVFKDREWIISVWSSQPMKH